MDIQNSYLNRYANKTLANQPDMPFESAIKEAFDAILYQIKDEEINSRVAKLGLNYKTCSSAEQFMLRAKGPLYFWDQPLSILTRPKITFYFKNYLAKVDLLLKVLSNIISGRIFHQAP